MKKLFPMIAALSLAVCLTAGVTLSAAAAPATYSEYINVSSQGSGLMLEPTLVLEPTEEAQLTGKGYASAVVTPDGEMKVDLGRKRPLKDLFDLKLKGKTIPVVRLDGETVDAFLEWLKTTYTVSDIMAISDEISVLEKVYADERGYLVNTVYDLTDVRLTEGRYDEWEHIAAANKAGCNILLYDVQENFPVAAEYVSAMSKVCWAEVESKEEGVQAIAAGCQGIVAKEGETLSASLGYFKEKGFARAQYIAAHRGITKYANEQSLTGIMASYNEGATHVEIDIQITSDGHIVSCHDNDISRVSGIPNKSIVDVTFRELRKVKLNNYSVRYEESFADIEEMCMALEKTDVILIVELKLDSASQKALDLKPIEKLKAVMEKYPGMKGHWITITFFAPYAEAMKETLPEIPCCYLGAGASTVETQNGQKPWDGEHKNMTNIGGKIEFLRKRNIGLDETMAGSTNSTAQNYLARGYVQNTWTFEDLSHFNYKANIATTNKAEDCAMLVKEVAVGELTLTEAQLSAKKAKVPCRSYSGWVFEYECDVIEVSRSGNTAQVLFYYVQQTGDQAAPSYGLYSQLKTVAIS